MTSLGSPLTLTAIKAEAARLLDSAGFHLVNPALATGWKAAVASVHEDANSIVCVAIYETWAHLSFGWADDQANLVDLISKYFARNEAKAWDGYLALFTPSLVPEHERPTAISIQRDTVRLRKLFADGSELKSIGAVRRTLLPVLPLDEHVALEDRNVLEALPPLLAKYGVSEEATKVAIQAFQGQRPIIEEIHTRITRTREGQS